MTCFHRKSTKIATSSEHVADLLRDVRCLRDHEHLPVIGGVAVTRPAGHYPHQLAATLVDGMEAQFDADFRRKPPREALAAEGGAEFEDDFNPEAVQDVANLHESDSDGLEMETPSTLKVTNAVKQAVYRLHCNTGHRSNARLARALLISGAPPEVVQCAKHLKCSICAEKQKPKTRQPASLPVPKDVSDQVHIDLMEVHDGNGTKFYVVHAVDWASRFQMAEVLEDKSSPSVEAFLKKRWFPIFGAPRVLIADQGKEFTSWYFADMANQYGILLWHAAIQAPWQNGVCERAGGALKAILQACITAHSVQGHEELEMSLQEAVTAYNHDVNDSGVSPAQAALGKQPRMHGDVLGNFENHLGEHGMILSKPGLARQIALRETAKMAMLRLHFSRGLRKALLARPRTVPPSLDPGSIVYFYRNTKYNAKTHPSKQKLTLKKWHGPALVIAREGDSNYYLSFKGQLCKCAAEHVRPASTMEQISAEAWRDAIAEVVEQAQADARQRPPDVVDQPASMDFVAAPSAAPADLEAEETPQLTAQELAATMQLPLSNAMTPHSSAAPSGLSSRRASTVSSRMPGSPVPELIRQASQQVPAPATPGRMKELLSRAQAVDKASDDALHPDLEGDASRKRAADQAVEELQEATGGSSASTMRPSRPEPSSQVFDAMVATRDEILEFLQDPNVHPLRQLWAQAMLDRENPLEHQVRDHGTWRGQWPLPSQSVWQSHGARGIPWPCGDDDMNDVMAVQTARKEYRWKNMDDVQRKAFAEAADTGWRVWVDNDAVEVLDEKTSKSVRDRLRRSNELHKILTPRFVYTDKHDGLRTESHQLPLRANARLVVPGFKDPGGYEVRKDAPTASRTSQHMIFIFAASFLWDLWSADVKSAFLKGEYFLPGERELFIENIRCCPSGEPGLPLAGTYGLAKLKKGIFGLSDSPRRWYLRLNRSLCALGWVRSSIDFAVWFLWNEDKTKLHGIVASHVDDLLLGGDAVAKRSLDKLNEELGFGALQHNCFTYCGKRIEMKDGQVLVSMKEYHENLKTVLIPVNRRQEPDSPLTATEQRQLRAVLGSLQWLVAQCRFDLGFQLSSLQGSPAVVATLMKANVLVKQFKQDPNFTLYFKPMNLRDAGLMVVSDASLGNVTKLGGEGSEPMQRVFSQASYFILVADKDLMNGRSGRFAILDARSHRLTRVCRSTFGAEVLGVEEGFDTGQYCRGVFAEALGFPMGMRCVDASTDSIPMMVVTDAKDTYDKSTSDTPSYGSQKSLAFTVAWIRSMLLRPNTAMRWTATENMFVDAGTKEMSPDHMHKILRSCQWSVTYNPTFVKQGKLKSSAKTASLVGKPVDPADPVIPHLQSLADQNGWHFRDGIAVHVARNARSFRSPKPRFDEKEFSCRSSYGRFDSPSGHVQWCELEKNVPLDSLSNVQGLLGSTASVLVTFFRRSQHSSTSQKEEVSPEKACIGQG